MPRTLTYRYTAFDSFLCFFIFFTQHVLLFLGIRGAYAAGSLCFILVYFYYFFQRRTFRKIAFTFPMWVWIALTVYHLINAMTKNVPGIDFIDWLHGFKIYACMVIVCYWCSLNFKKTVRTLAIVYALLLLFFLLSGYGSMSEEEGSGRLHSTTSAVVIGHWAGALSMFIALYCIMYKVRLVNAMLMFAYPLAFTFFSQGRVSMLMIFFSILGYAYTYIKTGGRQAMTRTASIVMIGSIGLVLVLIVYANSRLSRRMEAWNDYQAQYYYRRANVNPIIESIAGERTVYYYYGWQFFKANPTTGIGLGNYRYMTGGDYPMHPDIMVHVAEGGWIAIILYLIFHIYLVYNLWKIPKTETYKYVAIMGLVTILVISIWAGVFKKELFFPIYGIILYLIYKHRGIIKMQA